jgi:hypothetical protein
VSIRKDIQRYDGRGNVWCYCCNQYLPADRFRWHEFPSKKPGYWCYCRQCTRELDQMRYRASVSTPEGKAKVLEARYARKRRQRAKERRERRGFILNAVDILRRRGFTLKDISTLSGVSWTTFYGWFSGTRNPSEAAEARLAIVLRHTGHLPIGDERPYRRRTPHPEVAFLVKRMRPELDKHPMRSAWRHGRRERKAAA